MRVHPDEGEHHYYVIEAKSNTEKVPMVKCAFVTFLQCVDQKLLQGESANGEGCTKGGMSCERKYSYSTGETSCSTILTVR